MTSMNPFHNAARKILLLDGAMGTMIQRRFPGGVMPAGPAEMLNRTHPDIIASIHREYIEAGADIIETNTFNANRISLEAHGLADEARALALAGARIAREAAERFRNESGMTGGESGMTGGESGMTGGAGRKVLVAGSVGPTSRSLTLPSDISNPAWREVDFDTMAAAYREQIEALVEGGVDIILIETCFDALNAKAALYALQQVAPGFPAIVSVSVADRSGRTLTGQTLEAFYHSVRHYPLSAFGLNCSLGAEEMLPLVRDVASFSEFPVICYPNAGLPNEEGCYDQTPAEMAGFVGRMVTEGLVDIVGGCCGTTPEHIKALASVIPTGAKRSGAIASPPAVSGLDAHPITGGGTGFIPVGERTNVAGSRKFARLIGSGAYNEALQVAAAQVDAGAGIIDINMDDAMLDAPREMERFVRHISGEPAVAGAALMIDSSDWKAILAGLKNAQGRCIVNSVSLKEGEDALIGKAREIHALGAAMVVMAFDEEGQAVTYERKIAIASRAYRILTERAGIPPEDLIFDCNILSVGTGIPEHAHYAVDFIEAVRWIKGHLPGALTSGGVSNLSFAFRGNNPLREAMHSVFLYHAVQAGLDMAIVNPSALIPCDSIDPALREAVEDVVLDRAPDATERLLALLAGAGAAGAGTPDGAGTADGGAASQNRPKRAQPPQNEGGCVTKPAETCQVPSAGTSATDTSAGTRSAAASPATAAETLSAALVRGRSEGLEALTLACLEQCGSAVAVVEGPLMNGMEQVGKMFGEGRMFLPQVVKSARLMRDAVAVLEPYFPKDGTAAGTGRDGAASKRDRIVLATVKGDVHDIGKNITGIVLRCNGFDVTDLGVMVEGERILAEAERIGADLIAVSGLITPSLYQMEELCREMARRGMHTPLLIGGATTSAVHTAVKLAPLYGHVFYCPDASASAVMAKRLMIDRDGTEAAARTEQDRLRALRNAPVHKNPPKRAQAPETCTALGETLPEGCREIPLQELIPLFDERMYLAIWGIPYGKADMTDPAIAETLREARETLERMARRKEVRVTLSTRFLYGRHRVEDGLDWIDGYAAKMQGRETAPNILQQSGYATRNGKTLPGSANAETLRRICALPMLRDAQGRCLADWLPKDGAECTGIGKSHRETEGRFGVFAIAVHPTLKHPVGCDCPACGGLVERTIRLTLAEAASEWFEAQLRQTFTDASAVRIIKPAVGYAACPDHTLKKDVLGLLDNPGITLTDSYAMIPDASICAFVFAARQPAGNGPEAPAHDADTAMPDIRRISGEIARKYALARGFSAGQSAQFLGNLL